MKPSARFSIFAWGAAAWLMFAQLLPDAGIRAGFFANALAFALSAIRIAINERK